MNSKETLYLPIVAKAFAALGLPPELGAAIARQESNWDPNAATTTGGDATLGGSYGLCQMSLATGGTLARGVTREKLLDPVFNAGLAALLCKQNWDKTKSIQDTISRYNSGKDFFHAPRSTKVTYVPNVLKFMASYQTVCAQYNERPEPPPPKAA